MDEDTKAIVMGLSIGIGGFVGLLIAFCICWQIVCGSWCDKENDHITTRQIPVKNQRHTITTATTTKGRPYVSTVVPMRSPMISSGLKPSSSNDLASKVMTTS
ncbi:hypothetical protein I4U23_020947 [Adineta vaga]|nr:hypothetical protein I4U23_020947 [Adineta vaga]